MSVQANEQTGARRAAQLAGHADLLTRLAIGFALVGVARLLDLLRLTGLTGSAAGDAVIMFAIAAVLGVVAWRLRARRHFIEHQEND